MSVLCLGEALLVLTPRDGGTLRDAAAFSASIGGAEANVAIALAELGDDARWAGLLGSDPFGARVIDVLTRHRVDTALARVVGSAPTGLYFKPGDGGPVRYYRAGSAGSGLTPQIVADWASTASPEVVHVTGITAQISESGLAALRHLVGDRPFVGSLISFDVNHRAALAGPETPSRLLEIAGRSDIVFVGLDEAARLWGADTAEQVHAMLPQPRWLIVRDADREAVEFHHGDCVRVAAPRVEIVEPTGAGDAFTAGWLHELLRGAAAGDRLRRGHKLAGSVLRSAEDHVELGRAIDAFA